jgi:hypothetical protein
MKKLPRNLQDWVEARSRHRLSHAQVQMARELGMNPRKLGKLDNHPGGAQGSEATRARRGRRGFCPGSRSPA